MVNNELYFNTITKFCLIIFRFFNNKLFHIHGEKTKTKIKQIYAKICKNMQKYFIISELLNLAGGALGWFFVELYLPFF